MSLAPNQAKFVAQLSHLTGLDPKVVGAWALAEQSGSAATGYERSGNNNWLNIGNVDSNPTAGNKFHVWGDPITAARATAEWLRGRGSLAHEYGAPAAGIQRILGTAGHPTQAQIHAIADSGWASSGYNGGHTLEQLMGQVGNVPSGAMGMSPAMIPHSYMPNNNGQAHENRNATKEYEQSLAKVRGSNAIASLFSGSSKPGDEMLATLLHRELPQPTAPLGPSAVAKTEVGVNTKHLQTGSGTAIVDGKKVAAWIAPALEYAKQRGWKGTVQSGYRSYAEQKRIYDSGVRPAAVPGTSNHEMTAFPGGAVDVSEAQQLSNILKGSPYANKLVWAGSKDPVHFSHPHNGSY